MSNNLGINFAEDMEQVINDLPSVLTIGVRKYQCVADDERRSIEVEDEGFYQVYDREVTLPYSAVETMPDIQDVVTLDTVKYWIADKTNHLQTDTLILTLRRRDGGTTLN